MNIKSIQSFYNSKGLPEEKLRRGGHSKADYRDFIQQSTDEHIHQGQSAAEAYQFLRNYIRDNL